MADIDEENTPQGLEDLPLNEEIEAGAEEEVMSLDDLDALIASEDPEFDAQMKKLSLDEDLKSAEVQEDGLLELDEEDEQLPEIKKISVFEKYQFLKKHEPKYTKLKIQFDEKLLPKVTEYKLKLIGLKVTSLQLAKDFIQKCINLFFATKNFFRYGLPERFKKFVADAKAFNLRLKTKISEAYHKFKAYPLKKRVGIIGSVVFVIGVLFLVKTTVSTGWLPRFNKTYLSTIHPVAGDFFKYDSGSDTVELYRAFPQPKHIVWLDHVVVNLRRVNNYENPMATYDFYFDTDSKETAIEIKDRKKQMLDVVQRTLEEFTYKELSQSYGDVKLRSSVRNSINRVLNQGRVEEVYIKNKVLKP